MHFELAKQLQQKTFAGFACAGVVVVSNLLVLGVSQLKRLSNCSEIHSDQQVNLYIYPGPSIHPPQVTLYICRGSLYTIYTSTRVALYIYLHESLYTATS
eukprot:6463280-Amphidinium_carterae.1